MKKFKVFTVVIFTILILLFVSGCLHNASKRSIDKEQASIQKNSSSKNFPSTLSNTDVSILSWANQVDDYTDAIKLFEEKYGGKANINPSTNPEGSLVTALSAGDSFDITPWGINRMPRYAIKGLLQPIDGFFDIEDPLWDDVRSAMDQFRFKGKYYGVTLEPEIQLIYYNKTMFENNGLKTPAEYYKEGKWSWEALRELSIKLTQATSGDGNINQWGFAGGDTSFFVLSNGMDYVASTEDGNITLKIKDPSVIEALQFYQDAYVKDKYIPASYKNPDFIQGKIGITVGRTWLVDDLIKGNMKDEWDIAPFPVGPSSKNEVYPASCRFFGICNGAKNPEGAAAFLSIMKKNFDEYEAAALAQKYNPQQIELIKTIEKKVKISTAKGIGQFDKKLKNIYKDIKQGKPVVTIIEENTPTLQEEIDAVLEEMK